MFWNKKRKTTTLSSDELVESSESTKAVAASPPTFFLPRGGAIDHSPTIVNGTDYPIVVFLERGTLYNTQVLHPGEAVCMTRRETGGNGVLPYRVHAMIGDETSLPKKSDSVKNLIKVSAIPAAFVAGALMTAYSAGTLAGPAAALAPMVSGMVVKGVVIDTAALAAGSVMATRAQIVTELLLRKQKDRFVVVSPNYFPGQRHLLVTGGLSDGPLQMEEIQKRKIKEIRVSAVKAPMAIQGKNGEETVPIVTDGETITCNTTNQIVQEEQNVSSSLTTIQDQPNSLIAGTTTEETNKVDQKRSSLFFRRISRAPTKPKEDLIAATVM